MGARFLPYIGTSHLLVAIPVGSGCGVVLPCALWIVHVCVAVVLQLWSNLAFLGLVLYSFVFLRQVHMESFR